jgi:corrinoid protein of di/trimethylamine methyltransferase
MYLCKQQQLMGEGRRKVNYHEDYEKGNHKMSTKQELWKRLSDAVFMMEEEEVEQAAREYLEMKYPVLEAILEGLVAGMNRAGEYYEQEEYFVTDLLLCSDAMYLGLDILRPHLPEYESQQKIVGVIGVVEGDTHDIGKNLVKIMLETAGFQMIDLGRDVPLGAFVEAVREHQAQFLCLSTLMTTTMSGMERVIQLLEAAGLRQQVKVLIGGSPVSKRYADQIGADGYSTNAVEAVKLAKRLLQQE